MKHFPNVSIVILIIVTIAVFLLMSKAEIQFKPFKIILHDWHIGVGYFMIMIGVSIHSCFEYKRGFAKGFYMGTDETFNRFSELMSKRKDNDLKEDKTIKFLDVPNPLDVPKSDTEE